MRSRWFPLGKSNATLPLENGFSAYSSSDVTTQFLGLSAFNLTTVARLSSPHLPFSLAQSLWDAWANTNLSLLKFNEYQRRTATAHRKWLMHYEGDDWAFHDVEFESFERPWIHQMNCVQNKLTSLRPTNRSTKQIQATLQIEILQSTSTKKHTIHY